MAKHYEKVAKLVLFPNKFKDGEKNPDYTGNIEFNQGMVIQEGEKISIGVWDAQSKDSGIKYLNGYVTKVTDDDNTAPQESSDDSLPDF